MPNSSLKSSSQGALDILLQKKNLRLLTVAMGHARNDLDMKRIGGGLLVQTPDTQCVSEKDLKVVTKLAPTSAQISDMMFAWKIAKFIKSNTIVFVRDGMTLGVGAGQMSRVDSARIASIKAKEAGLSLEGSVAASDAFFPFRDGLDVIIDAGATAVIQPGGSIRDEEVIAAAKAAHAHRFIQTLPEGYNTVLNEEASNVSQGQKQLLTIARAILADNRLLILDEATSSVDTRTEERIQKAMDYLMKGRTSFVIAHRLSTIKDADVILVMKDGDIIEQGNHEDLLAMNGFYANLYNSQFEKVS